MQLDFEMWSFEPDKGIKTIQQSEGIDRPDVKGIVGVSLFQDSRALFLLAQAKQIETQGRAGGFLSGVSLQCFPIKLGRLLNAPVGDGQIPECFKKIAIIWIDLENLLLELLKFFALSPEIEVSTLELQQREIKFVDVESLFDPVTGTLPVLISDSERSFQGQGF